MDSGLGRLEKCDVRKTWSNENDFSDWLYRPENISFLCESLGIGEISSMAREDSVGDFRVDIFGEDSANRKVIIENQFEASNHDHLGKIITYAAGKDASIIIWIVEHARPEHASAVSWLNNNISDKGFYLVEIEVWRIGNSLPAPKFNVVEQPNEYIQAQKSIDDPNREFKYSIWQNFIDWSSGQKDLLKAFPGTDNRKPSGDHWMTFRKGCKGNYQLDAKVFTRGSELQAVAVDVWIPDNKEQYMKFEEHRAEVEQEMGTVLEWSNKENNKAASIRLKRDLEPEESKESVFGWISNNLIRMQKVFNKYV